MLEVRGVTKRFDGRPVVDDVTFQVERGEVFALLGPNGAGKTTLIRMITDILRPDIGTIRFEGRPVDSEARHAISYLPEERGLYRRARVIEVLGYFGELKGMPGRRAREAARELLDRVELGEWAEKQVQTLSKGMQQKVQLCTALIGSPRLLILDEPFTGLDPLNVQLFEEILAERSAQGTTVLLSTHQMNKVEQVCDRALMIHRGRMVLYDPVRTIRKRYADHAVLVRTEDALGDLPGVKSIQSSDGDHKLTLEADATAEAVLRALLERRVRIESFALATLPLEDIFVKVVREGLGLDHGESALPTEPLPAASSRS
jgi:ABC-2 type transport system ATP-binding protein